MPRNPSDKGWNERGEVKAMQPNWNIGENGKSGEICGDENRRNYLISGAFFLSSVLYCACVKYVFTLASV